MKWFVAKNYFQVITGSGSDAAQFDEQLRLISADTEAAAYGKAQQLGQAEEESFLNVRRQPVHWKWLGVTELREVPGLQDGAELFSALQETAAAPDLLRHISDRSRMLQQRYAPAAGSRSEHLFA